MLSYEKKMNGFKSLSKWNIKTISVKLNAVSALKDLNTQQHSFDDTQSEDSDNFGTTRSTMSEQGSTIYKRKKTKGFPRRIKTRLGS